MIQLPTIRGLGIIRPIVIGIIIAFILRLFFFSSYIVEGSSMTPTLHDGNLVVINKLSYQFDELKRFDVIVFHANQQDDYVKRVIGLPGDRISYEDGKLYVNGSLIEETFLEKTGGDFSYYKEISDFTLQDITGEETVPPGMIFVIGDNRLGSYDSRHFGFIEVDQVVGKVNLRYYPFQHIDISF
ncbi:signal peptidase I [Bacillus mesophilus]|uniref:Signal peptidase I n=1 Tax=Bacillus mesophilus TaxID=1808955 RepID=A0A6M0Q4I6_9BACI|nr:signal peptidase I [Bacillus mesophilus]MBM7659840.1 signal peptidase I [Bacillus mesophilus]NEY70699.1 signal peptidase I [Bacillus mesophilus]